MAFFFFNSHHAGTSDGITSSGMSTNGVSCHSKVFLSRCAINTWAILSAGLEPLVCVIVLGPMATMLFLNWSYACHSALSSPPYKALMPEFNRAILLARLTVKSESWLPRPIINSLSMVAAWHARQLGPTTLAPLVAVKAV